MTPDLKTGDVIAEIPHKSNFKIVGYEIAKVRCGNNEPQLLYKPIYNRIHTVPEVYWTGKEFVYVINDNYDAYTVKGESVNVTDVTLKRANFADFNAFFDTLFTNGYKIKHGVLEKLPENYYYPIYTLDFGFIPSKGVVGDSSYEKYNSWDEAFETRNDCINWCNYLNEKLNRNYPEQEREKDKTAEEC